MIGRIGPLVRGRQAHTLVFLHVAGGALGGISVGAVLAVLGVVTSITMSNLPWLARLLIAGLLLFAGLSDLGLLPALQGIDRQTPGSWTCSLGKAGGVFSWGVDLGLGVSTRLPAQGLLAVLACATLVGDPVLTLGLTFIYGVTRAATVGWAVLRSHGDIGDTCRVYESKGRSLREAVGVVGVVLGTAVLFGDLTATRLNVT